MREAEEKKQRLEIGHVLFIDIVGYSKLLIDEQSLYLEQLREIARETTAYRAAEREGKLMRLPTGDGGALVFRTGPEEPVLCAIEIARALKQHPDLRVRIGVHSGPIVEVTDIRDQGNIAGAGINIAQRVMDCGDAGHILLSKHVADDLEQFAQWRPLLHDLGTCEVKHGVTLALFNLYSTEFGNPARPEKFRRQVEPKLEPAAPVLPPRKSIAVLPFENLSDDKANEYFADGIQEEILTRLSRIADLKVISRTSTQRFKSATGHLPEIAQQLGVANILEGSVRKAADKVRVHVQLIDAVNDSHLWAERYDRQLLDIFEVESDIAAHIADALQAKLTSAEERTIASRPTENSEAHELYLRGRFYWNKPFAPDFHRSREYYEQAIALDPTYAPAYAGLADYYGFAFANGLLPPEEKWAKAEEENATKALQLDPALGEAYNPLAAVKLYHYRDWPGAERDFRRGLELSPNFAEMRLHYAVCLVLFGRNEDAAAQMRRALELDPLSSRVGWWSARLFWCLRQYDAAIDRHRKTLEIEPNFSAAHEALGYLYEAKQAHKEAIAEWSKALKLSHSEETALLLEQTYAASGFESAVRALAEKEVEELQARLTRGEYVAPLQYVIAYCRMGDHEQAFRWLTKAVAERTRLAFEIKIDPLLDPLRSDPRFDQIARTLPS